MAAIAAIDKKTHFSIQGANRGQGLKRSGNNRLAVKLAGQNSSSGGSPCREEDDPPPPRAGAAGGKAGGSAARSMTPGDRGGGADGATSGDRGGGAGGGTSGPSAASALSAALPEGLCAYGRSGIPGMAQHQEWSLKISLDSAFCLHRKQAWTQFKLRQWPPSIKQLPLASKVRIAAKD